MKHSTTRILTSHAGSLPRPDELIGANRGGTADERLSAAVLDVVQRQKDIGIDIPGDGEYGKAFGHRINYGAWWSYSFQRLGRAASSRPMTCSRSSRAPARAGTRSC